MYTGDANKKIYVVKCSLGAERRFGTEETDVFFDVNGCSKVLAVDARLKDQN